MKPPASKIAALNDGALPVSPDPGFRERLGATCFDFDFFSAVRKLDAHYAGKGFPRIGYSASRQGDPFHLGQVAFLNFAPRTIHSWNEVPPENCRFGRPALLVYFLGYFGPNGALPLQLTTHALERERAGDFAFTNFANIFQHRLLCFYYRAWAACRIAVDRDRGGHQRFPRFIGSLCGTQEPMGKDFSPQPREQKSADALPTAHDDEPAAKPTQPNRESDEAANDSWARLFFAGHMISRNRRAEGLTSIISSYFGVPASIEPFQGCWLELPAGSESKLASSGTTGLLGRTTLLGRRFWDCQGNIRIRIGPVGLAKFQKMLPGTLGAKRLRSWVSEYLGAELQWDLQLILSKDAVPETRLGHGGQLGYTSFLKSRECEQDVDTAIFDLSQAA